MNIPLVSVPSTIPIFLYYVSCAPCCLQELCDLLTGLLNTDSAARLSIPEVQASPWFDGFDWQALQDKTLPPPVLPSHALACAQT